MPPSSSGQDTRLIPVLGARLAHNVGSNPTGGILLIVPIAQPDRAAVF